MLEKTNYFRQFNNCNASYVNSKDSFIFVSYQTPMFVINKKSKTIYINKCEYSMTTKKQMNNVFSELKLDNLKNFTTRKNLKTFDMVDGLRVIRKNYNKLLDVYYKAR